MTVRDLVNAMETIAPPRHAEPWDNVGLLVGDAAATLTRVMLCIDLTPEVVAEAVSAGCEGVVAYHPPIFKKPESVVAGTPVYEAVRGGLSVFTPHTALDVAVGGTNDTLADVLGLTDRRPIRPTPGGEFYKLVTFVPTENADAVRDAMFAAGAGRVGDYDECSFASAGTGTFRGGEKTNPAVGQAGRRESVEEVRLEVAASSAKLAAAAVAAMKSAHPYEEVAYELVKVAHAQGPGGLGRVGRFDEPVGVAVLIERIKRGLGLDHVLIAGPTDGEVSTAACCAGSCGDLLDDAIRAGATFYLTGEMRHHDALKAARAGVTVACVLHSNSERATLSRLRRRLGDLLPGLDVLLSGVDRDPFVVL